MGFARMAAGLAIAFSGLAGVAVTQAAEPAPLVDPRRLTLAGAGAAVSGFVSDGALMIRREAAEGAPALVILSLTDGQTQAVEGSEGLLGTGAAHPTEERALAALPQQGAAADNDLGVLHDIDAQGVRRLAQGHDGAYAPGGRAVVFSSALCGAPQVEGAENRRLCHLDLETGEIRPLTTPEVGEHDREPAWSPDGTTIVFSRRGPAGSELYRLGLEAGEGAAPVALTALGARAEAPVFHPSGAYLAFVSTSLDDGDADLFLLAPDGAHEPMRVLARPGPQSHPQFAPGGGRIAWTGAIMTGGGEDEAPEDTGRREVFLAGWNHKAARALLRAAPPRQALEAPAMEATVPGIDEDDLRRHVAALSAEALEGRLTGTAGERAATAYMAAAFEAIGLAPAGDDGYFQPFTFRFAARPTAETALIFTRNDGEAPAMALDEDWVPLAFSATGETEAAPVVFGGFGFDAPAWEGHPPVDSYGDLDVAGKWVLVWRGNPPGVSGRDRPDLTRLSSFVSKAQLAADKGAAGIILMRAPGVSTSAANLPGPTVEADEDPYPIPVVVVAAEHNETLLAGEDLEALLAMAEAGERIARPLPDLSAQASIGLEVELREGRNVLGRLDLDGSADRAPVILGGHIDHLGIGFGAAGEEPADEPLAERRRRLHPGADDNASGTAAIIEVAQSLAANPPEGAVRDVILAAWSGEELGLLGSSHYVDQMTGAPEGEAAEEEPPVLTERIAAYLNLDMVGRLREALQLRGVATSPDWPRAIERANAGLGLPLDPRAQASRRMDTVPFQRAGVPTLAFYTGWHEDYHRPADRVELIDFAGLARVTAMVERMTRDLARAPAAPALAEAEDGH
ncbi:MAG: M28 family peptidase [Pseudomonadota bacterium]